VRNVEQWRSTKFVQTPKGLRASRDRKHVCTESRFIADIVAIHYARALQCHARGRLLDLGCGHAPLYEIYRDLASENVCVDWQNTFHVNPFLDQTMDLNGEWPFEPATFDTVLLTDVLEHIPEPMNVMRQVAAVLRSSGKLILGVPFFYWLHEEPHDYHRYTKHALRRFCDLAGLRVVALESYGGLPEVLLDLTSKGLEMLPRPLAASLRPFHTLAVSVNGTMPFRKFSFWSREEFPLGYVLVAEKPAA
jgi:SAM-dependent methyltransferase